MVVAVLCGILVTTTVHWKGDHLSESKNAIPKAVTLAKTIDLSRYGATRGMEQEQQSDRAISLPRATIDLDLIVLERQAKRQRKELAVEQQSDLSPHTRFRSRTPRPRLDETLRATDLLLQAGGFQPLQSSLPQTLG
jgi:hypothetical protein